MEAKSRRKDRVTLGDLVLAEVVLMGHEGADTQVIHDRLVASAQRDDVNQFRTSRILIGLQTRGLVKRHDRKWTATFLGLERAVEWSKA